MMKNGILKVGQKLKTVSDVDCEIEELLGDGTQGEVYRVSLAGKKMALKWYKPEFARSEQKEALASIVKRDAPNDKFLWPLDLVIPPGGSSFGYIMHLREDRYHSLTDLMRRRVKPSFRVLMTAAFYLVDSYFQLHAQGLCYRDINFGNVFFDPKTGDVLICDNDNVAVNGDQLHFIDGTPRFIAPEIIRGQAVPSTKTDLFSLSVLLFYLLMTHHPLDGKKEAAIQIFDQEAQRRLYGIEPVFIFDPNDESNRPVPGYQDNVLIFWPLYPQFLRNLFTRAFTDGLKDPENGRVRENEWRNALVRLRDSIFYCPHCNAENFYDVEYLKYTGGKPAPCWKCRQTPELPFRMRIGDTIIMLNHDTQLFPHHIDFQCRWDFSHPVAEVSRHPHKPALWGLKNLSQEKWILTKSDGSIQEVETGRNAPLAAGNKINFGNVEGEIRY
jgi:DNA-binding helix-hairpin-helix protein with protein kinase domain